MNRRWFSTGAALNLEGVAVRSGQLPDRKGAPLACAPWTASAQYFGTVGSTWSAQAMIPPATFATSL
jgi:hypothetical protein